MDYSTLSKEEKKDIFEVVNTTHLKLKGDQKKQLKRQFTTVWKINKSIGAFELLMKLYEAEDVYDEMNDWFQQFVSEQDISQVNNYKNKKNISYAKHRRTVSRRDEEIDELKDRVSELEDELEELKEKVNQLSS